jgi:hypothetical protein
MLLCRSFERRSVERSLKWWQTMRWMSSTLASLGARPAPAARSRCARTRGRSGAEERRLRREADERPLELAHVAPDALRDVEADVVGELDVLELRLLAHDGDARLELGAWMSATSPHWKRETSRSSILSSCCGYLSLVTTICLSPGGAR